MKEKYFINARIIYPSQNLDEVGGLIVYEDKNDDDHNEPRVNYEPHNRNLVNISLLLHTVVARKVEFERFKI